MEQKQFFAEQFSAPQRRKYRHLAIASAITGCVSEWALDSNTLIILYLVMLGGSESFSMFSSAISGMVSCIVSIPFAGIANKIGLRLSYRTAVFIGMAAFGLMAAAPFFGEDIDQYIVICGCFAYCISRPLYSATWYPICDAFLLKSERGAFFGNMRFIYMTINSLLIFAAGKLMGAKPAIWVMQLVILMPGIILYGRKVCMERLPVNPASEKNAYDLIKALIISIRNAPLIGFAFYLCMINMSVSAAIPLSILYMKKVLGIEASHIMTITALGLAGYISGYGIFGKLSKKVLTKHLQLTIHIIFIVILASLFMIRPDSKYLLYKFSVIFYLNGIASAILLCVSSTEMLALAKPTNKIMASAIINTFQNLGTMIGRTGSSIILGLGILTEQWNSCGNMFTKYNTLFGAGLFLTVFSLLFLLLVPAFVPRHKDYYEPVVKK